MSTLYAGNGEIEIKGKKIEFEDNLYICKFNQSPKGFNIAIAVDCKIKDNKIYGKTITFSAIKTDEEEIRTILDDIYEYANDNLTLIFEDNTSRWKRH